jgi:protein-S-isoprenylcysteine O-methyltransferase Ste14
MEKRLGPNFRFYRLFFNIFSIVTIIPVIAYSFSLRTAPVITWDGWLQLPQILLIVLFLWCFIGGAMKYDLPQLLGIRQIFNGRSHKSLSRTGKLDATGILGMIRHPWYAGTIPAVWARDLDMAAIIFNIMMNIYIVIGTLLEEKKLCREFGKSYREYQEHVSMFFPWKYFRKKLSFRR